MNVPIDSPARVLPNAFNIADAARYIGLGPTKFRELLRAGTIGCRRAGRRVIVARAELDRFLGTA
jgi:excisionase family DNA binding protein